MRFSITMTQYFTLALITLSFLFSNQSVANQIIDSTIISDELKIRNLLIKVQENKFNDSLHEKLNIELLNSFEKTLNKKGSFLYSFDSIAPISKIESNDGLLRVFTWFTINSKGVHKQYGFLQYYAKSKEKVLLYKLNDQSDQLDQAHKLSLQPENWYGAVYYDVIENKYLGTTLYTLIGWDGNNLFSNKKIIESLVFSESGRPKFGKSVFKFGKTKVKRIIYEYSRMANMMIHYDHNLKMIVMDHLAPSNEIYTGNFNYYGPDLSYDALEFKKDIWIYSPNIDYKQKDNRSFFDKLFGKN